MTAALRRRVSHIFSVVFNIGKSHRAPLLPSRVEGDRIVSISSVLSSLECEGVLVCKLFGFHRKHAPCECFLDFCIICFAVFHFVFRLVLCSGWDVCGFNYRSAVFCFDADLLLFLVLFSSQYFDENRPVTWNSMTKCQSCLVFCISLGIYLDIFVLNADVWIKRCHYLSCFIYTHGHNIICFRAEIMCQVRIKKNNNSKWKKKKKNWNGHLLLMSLFIHHKACWNRKRRITLQCML